MWSLSGEDQTSELGQAKTEVGRGYEKVRDEVTTRVDTAREDLRERRIRAEEAVRAGRDAARKAREDLERRVAESKDVYREKVARAAAEADADPTDETAG